MILVDEASMMDAEIMMRLFSSIGEKTHVVLLGDVDQLPPVETGFLFSDLVEIFCKERGAISVLSKTHRFENLSLVQIASWIKEEKREELFSFLENSKKSYLPLSSIFSEIVNHLSYFLFPSEEKKDVSFCLDQLEKFCILTPLRKGPFGVEKLNFFIKRLLFQRSKIGEWYYLPVLVCKNDPEHNLYNGMLGVVIGRVTHKKQFSLEDRVYFRLGNEVLDLPAYILSHYEEAFCLSIHKSQGSEFDKVFLCLPPGSERFGKELFYTGVTRAKRELVLVGERKEIEETLKTTMKRNSALVARF
jgi:exodeoxyribonuclease V alpha subunit